ISPYANVTADGSGSGLDVYTGGISVGSGGSTSSLDPSSPGGVGIETNDPTTLSNAENGNSSSLKSQGQVGTPSIAPMNLGSGSTDGSGKDSSLQGVRTVGLAKTTGNSFHGVAVAASNRDEIRTFTLSLAAGVVG